MADFDLIPTIYNADSDILILDIKAKELTKLSGYPRGKNAIESSGQRASWKLMAPNEIMDEANHTWEPFESIATRLAQTTANIHKTLSTAKQLQKAGSQAVQGTSDALQSDEKSIGAMRQMISSAAYTAAGQELTGLLNYRVDSSLIYKDSDRRRYTFSFELGAYDSKLNEKTIFEAVRELQKLSCPQMDGGMIKIKFPAVFTITTLPVPFIKINYAALTSVQPTWSQPYKNGYPTRVSLQLTFQDILPLYQKSFEQGGIVRTS